MASLLLTLASYGYEWALLGEFGVRPEQLNLSPSDYLLRAYRPVLSAFTQFADERLLRAMSTDDRLGSLIVLLYVVMATTVAVSAYLAADPGRRRAIGAWASRPIQFVKKLPSTTRHRVIGWGAPVYVAATLALVSAVATALVYTASVLVLFFVVVVPITSLQDARAFARTAVIGPKHCRVGATSDSSGAQCYRVVVQGRETARGRYVDQGLNRILLYHTATRGVVIASLDGAVLESVESE